MEEIKLQQLHQVSNYYQNKIQIDEWPIIASQVSSYVLQQPDKNYLTYPGFFFDSRNAQHIYETKVYQQYIDEKVYTPPRGNLSSNNDTIILGIKPGSYRAEMSRSESAWIFGPSSQLLHRLLQDYNIYPYFTNVYKSHYDETNHQLSKILHELIVIIGIHAIIYGKKHLNIICLGSYEEYNSLKNKILTDEKILNLNIELKMNRIYHPSYLLRSYSDHLYDVWKNDLSFFYKKPIPA